VIEISDDDDDLETLQVMHRTCRELEISNIVPIQDELKLLRDRIARKKAKKSVKREPGSSADDVIDIS
jgi:uncharacterized small protein (DUF1192 family)